MDIKNFLRQKKENKKKRTMWAIIILVTISILLALFFFVIKNYTKIIYEVGDQITIEGRIIPDNNFPVYTHSISDLEQSFGLKSSTINLNNFVDKNLIINGQISELSNKLPVLQITNIKMPHSKMIVKDNKYFFTNELVSFDFSKDLDLSAEKTGRNINIYYQGEPILSMETFVCSKITPTQNCEEMVVNYTKNLNEMFTTYLGYFFYKNKEKTWVTLNDNTIGYIFKTSDNNTLLNLSHLINIINSKFILEHKQDLILKHCSDEENNIKTKSINNLSKEIIDENLIRIRVEGVSTDGEYLECRLTVSIRDDREVKTSQLSYLE